MATTTETMTAKTEPKTKTSEPITTTYETIGAIEAFFDSMVKKFTISFSMRRTNNLDKT